MKKRKLDGKIVRFVSVDRKYMRVPYPAVAPLSSTWNIYVTGQHRIPGDEDTSDYLTLDEMQGEEDITPKARAKKFSYVIDPMNPVFVTHMKSYDCRLNEQGLPSNPKDYWEANFIMEQDWLVAPKRSSVKQSKHKFYLDDKEADAVELVQKSDNIYEAEKLIREKATIADYPELIKFLNIYDKEFFAEPSSMTEVQMKAELIKTAERNASAIIFAFSEEAENYRFLAQLIDAGIASKKQDGFWFNNTFLGEDSVAFSRFCDSELNRKIVSQMGSMLKTADVES